MKIRHFFSENNIPFLVKKMGEETDPDKLLALENVLLVRILAPIFLMGTLISLVLGNFWDKPTHVVIRMSLTLLSVGIGMIYGSYIKMNEVYKRHGLSVMLLIVCVMAYWNYYQNLGSLFWLFVLVLILPVTLSSSKITFYYLFTFGIVAVAYSFFSHVVVRQTYDQIHYSTVMFVFFFLTFTILIINRFYQYIIKYKMTQYSKIVGQQEELSGLYEEIVASEEELREQNEKLHEYNQEIRENEKRLEYLANQDVLTGLANRKRLLEELDRLIEENDHGRGFFALVFIDLDNFKKINDTLGHHVGDELLVSLGKRLSNNLQKRNLLCRLGGDEFALVVPKFSSEESLYGYLRELLDLMNMPFKILQYELSISASLGICLYPTDGETADELLRASDTAMYKVKASGKNDLQFFREFMKEEIIERINMEYQLIKALKKGELFLEYQPLVYLESEDIKGFEALIRWQSPEFGLISPSVFIPMAEELGIIYDIGLWVFSEVCRMSKAFYEHCGRRVILSVNVSALQLGNPNFLEDIGGILDETDVDPRWIEIEVTESVFIDDIMKAKEILMTLRKIGFRIAIDDFGTGYSSLSYLMELPVDTLKLDKSFIDKMLIENSRGNVVDSIIAMAHNLNMNVVAEGVEAFEQVAYLQKQQCDIIQGYYFSKPLPSNKLCHYKPKGKRQLVENIDPVFEIS